MDAVLVNLFILHWLFQAGSESVMSYNNDFQKLPAQQLILIFLHEKKDFSSYIKKRLYGIWKKNIWSAS